jgi:hypothetical protein
MPKMMIQLLLRPAWFVKKQSYTVYWHPGLFLESHVMWQCCDSVACRPASAHGATGLLVAVLTLQDFAAAFSKLMELGVPFPAAA